jgi:hypothetical protein
MSAGKINSKSRVRNRKWSRWPRTVIAVTAIALAVLGVGASSASAQDPIVGLWEIAATGSGSTAGFVDNVFSGWTSDGLEFDQDTAAPILTGYVCYGRWIKLKNHTYGLTHPLYDYDAMTGVWLGTSGHFEYTVTVSKDGTTFTGAENFTDGVSGPNPYTGTGGTTYTGITLSATKIEVDKSLLP